VTGRRARVHECTAAALEQVRERVTRAQQVTAKVHLEGVVEHLERHLERVRVATDGLGREVGGVGVHRVESAVLAYRRGDQRGDRRLVGDVERRRQRAPTGVAHLRGNRVGIRSGEVTDHDCRALGTESTRGRGADPRTAACHHDDLVGQTPHVCAPLVGSRTGSTVVPSGILSA